MTAALATRQTFDALRREDEVGEWWSARDLMLPLGYERWERFEDAIQRAELAAEHLGEDAPDHFRGAAKKVEIGSGAVRVVTDYRLTRFASYLLAMNGDPRKPEIAAAQTYFAVQTRRAELAPTVTIDSLDRRALARMVIEAEDAREIAEQRAAELAPLASFADELILADGDYSVREAAQVLCRAGIVTGERRLFATLKGLCWIQDAHRAFQRHVDIGRVRLRTDTFYDRMTGDPHVSTQIRITAKGLKDLHGILGNPRIEIASP